MQGGLYYNPNNFIILLYFVNEKCTLLLVLMYTEHSLMCQKEEAGVQQQHTR